MWSSLELACLAWATTKAFLRLVSLAYRQAAMLLPIPLANIALSFLNRFFLHDMSQHPHARPPPNDVLTFHLRHVHAATSSAHVYLSDVPHDLSLASGGDFDFLSTPLSISTSPVRTTRPSSLDEFTVARHMSMRGQSGMLGWEVDEVSGPDVTRRETLLLLAKMTSNSYFTPGTNGWYDLTDDWDVVRRLQPASARHDTLCV
jgi:hypothetical protein